MNDLKNWKGLDVDYVCRPGVVIQTATRKMLKTVEYFRVIILLTYFKS